jgi:adenine specific DNA methylase Mod
MIQQIAKENEAVTPISREMEGLKEYFPQCFNAQGEFDIDKFREAIQPQVDVTREGRSYDFLGKSYARMLSSLDTTTVIRPDTEHNAKPENANSENIYISGDNLDALHHLVKSYAGQVKCIYIDPPYNTGTDGFVYNDKFKFTAEELEKKLSISPDEAEKIIAMTSGHRASHAAWLTFMMPRLQLARDLMSKDGVIFISIDDNEQAYLKQLCDNVFGEDNYVGAVIWHNATDNNPTNLTIEHEYILCYTYNREVLESVWKSNLSAIKDILIEKGEELTSNFQGDSLQKEWKKWYRENKNQLGPFEDYKFIDEDGVYTGSRSVHNPGKEGYRYDIIHPITKKPCAQPLMGYRFPETSMLKMIDEGRILFGDDETKLVEIKLYASEYQDKFSSVYEFDSRAGANELKKLFPEAKQIFKNPKPSDVIMHILSYMNIDKDKYVMDFFGGSSTTADAIMQLNADADKQMKYILVQLPEVIAEDKEAYKLGYRTIDEIGIERIKRAAKKIKEENPLFAGDLGFKHYTLEEVPENTLDKLETFDPNVILSTDDVLNMFGRDTVLQTWLVNDGYGLGATTEDVVLDKYHATLCGRHLYLTDADFTEDAMTALVDRYQSDPAFNPDCIVLFGYSFGHNAMDMLEKNKPTINLVKDKNIIIDVRY